MAGRQDGMAIGRVAGAQIVVKPSLVVISVLLAFIFARRFDGQLTTNNWFFALVFVVALYLSVFAHELAHLLAARAWGMPVKSITLHMLGGETLIEGESKSPAQEFVTSLIGPLVSAIIGAGALAVHAAEIGGEPMRLIFWALGVVNLLIAAFNMLPGLPLDGGHVLRAIIWQITGKEQLGIKAAGWIGRIVALGVLAWGIWALVSEGRGAITEALLAGFVAWFLWRGSTHAIVWSTKLVRVRKLDARSLARNEMPPDHAVILSADLTGRELLIALAENPSEHYALFDDSGAFVGTLHTEDLDRAYREQ